MKPILNLLVLDHYPIFQQLQLEEALLRADDQNWCLVNSGTPHAIVMGISGKPRHLINEKIFHKNPIPVIRRFSGGGTVFVDEHTQFITFICQAPDIGVACYPQHILQWTEKFYTPIFPDGFRLIENDYAIGKHKFGGNAQYFRKERWLHHSSLLWDFSEENMNYLKMPKSIPKYRENREHVDFLCKLKDFTSRKEIEKRLLDNLERHFMVRKHNIEEVNKILERPHRKATTHVLL